MRALPWALLLTVLLSGSAHALDRPWICDTFFYWYQWNYDKELGGWMGGVYNTPLRGYYDSSRQADDQRSLHDACEWGITHHFMDYWGYGWKAEDNTTPRESVVMQSAENLRKLGYDVFMSFYQDGEDFDMAHFSRNLDPGRHTEFYVRNYHDSPAQPKLGGKPVYLIYGRNGSPKASAGDEGFRAWLEARYKTVAALNGRWGTELKSFAEAKMDLGARGWQRADAVRYQYQVWADEMARTNRAAQERFNLPGCLFSWDVAYGPFYNSFALQPKVFCGPHSYGGIFGVPHEADVERFIQAALAKRYDTIFFDTFKNYYHDWEIRIPGTCYPSEFCAFDRFWVQALSHYAEALVHLSWNEWWEGSNLEPCYEYGKTYPEKNLLYSTLMKQCFGSIHRWNEGAKVAVLLNDWHWQAGGRHPEDIYACIQALRRNNVRFDLLPDDFVTAPELAKFDVVLAPSGGLGFGTNAGEESISDLLLAWAEADPGHKLLVDDYSGLSGRLGLTAAPAPSAAAERGPDMNLYVDVGEEGDEKFLVDGASGREDWGKIPPDQFGASERRLTMRWTPAAGSTTTFMLPFSPGRDHILRLKGSVIWPNHVTVLVDGMPAAEFDLRPEQSLYEIPIAAKAVGGLKYAELTLRYAVANVPKEKDPQRFGGETRVCNLALDWLQLATAGTPFSTVQSYKLPQVGMRFRADAPGKLAGRLLGGTYSPHARLAAPPRVLSTYATDGLPRDMVLGKGGNVLYVNGLFSGVDDEVYLDSLVRLWALGWRTYSPQPQGVMVTPLQAGDTDVLLAYNYAAPQERAVSVTPPPHPGAPPVAELRVLSRDGAVPQRADLPRDGAGDALTGADRIKFYGVYEATRSWVALETPELSLCPGETRKISLGLKAVDGAGAPVPVRGKISLVPLLPSLTADGAEFELARGAQATVALTFTARGDADWGHKTVVFDVEVNGRHAYFWRTLLVTRLPDLQVTGPVVDRASRTATLRDVPFPWATDAEARDLRLTTAGGEVKLASLPAWGAAQVTLADAPAAEAKPALKQTPARLSYTVGGSEHSKDLTLTFATYPDTFPQAAEAVAPMLVANPYDEYLENVPVTLSLPAGLARGKEKATYVREAAGNVVPSERLGGNVTWLAMLPPQSVTLYYLCAGEAPQPGTDLVVQETPDTVTVSNSKLSLTWDKRRGGTVTSFLSRATGRDYGAGSFGAGVGTWGKFDPRAPAMGTDQFVSQEKKAWQREATDRATVTVRPGALAAQVTVAVRVGGAQVAQTFQVGPYDSGFWVSSEVKSPRPAEEIVALDVRLARNEFTKIFPNFTGISEGFTGNQPSAGWRESRYIPPYATMMAPDQFQESLSVLPLVAGGTPDETHRYRHGFWPEARPRPGPVKYAQIELTTRDASSTRASAYILLHPGYQTTARRFRQTRLDQPPTVILPGRFQWKGQVAAGERKRPADWWNPYWHFAVPVTMGPLEGRGANPQVSFQPDFGLLLQGCPALDLRSPRAVVKGPAGFAQLPLFYDPDSGEMTVTLTDAAWGAPPPALRRFMLYFDTVEGGGKCVGPGPVTPLATTLLNGSFEDAGKFWELGGGATLSVAAHTGHACARLEFHDGMGPVVVSNNTLRLTPGHNYRVSFWARTDSAAAALRTNFFLSAQYDFPQFGVSILPGEQWRRYEQVLPVGDFPPGMNPALRFWALGQPQTVYLDDVEVEDLTPGLAPVAPPMTFGAVSGR